MRTIVMTEVAKTGYLVSATDGQRVFEEVYTSLLEGKQVALSFKGREHVIVAFLNVVVGQLYAGRIEEQVLAKNLTYIDLSDDDQDKIDLVIKNAKAYFANRTSRQSG